MADRGNPALDPARNVSVSASAGTGKTWLLTARIVRLLLEGHAPGGILALTFTRKAAAEMRERVAARLRTLAFADDAALAQQLSELGLDVTPERTQRARSLYEALQFSPWPLRAMTLHAFCQELVARFALQCGVTPGAELVESEGELQSAAWQAVQQDLLRQPESAEAQALRRLIEDGYGESALREIVTGFLDRRNDWRAYSAQADGDPLSCLDAALRERLQLDPAAMTRLDTPPFEPALQEFHRLLDAVEVIGKVKAARLQPALAARGAQRLTFLQSALYTQAGTPYAFEVGKGKRKQLGDAQADRLSALHAQLIETLEYACEQQRRAATQARTLAGCTLGSSALRAFETELRRRAALPFPELEWHACRLLAQTETAEWVQYKLDQRIDHLLVDEFQDTSNTQWQLLLPLLEEMAAGGSERPRSAFIVGDIKQSIYGFRRANPELMDEAGHWLAEHLQGLRAELSDSRRSAPAIIDFVNAVFAQEAAREQLPDFPQHGTHRQQDWGRVEVSALISDDEQAVPDEPFRNPLITPRRDPESQRARREGEQIAQRIAALVAARPDIGGRALGYGDVMILLRKRTHQQAIEQALTQHGIPFTGAARGTLLDTVEAGDLTALLRFLNSPERDLDLAQVLRSPLFAYRDEALAPIAQRAKELECTWFDALGDAAPALLHNWLRAARRLPPHDLLDRIYAEGNLAARYESALPTIAAARVRANLNAYLQLALEVDSGRAPSLSKFLRQLQQWSGQDAPDEAPPPGRGGQVRILTVHAAKGLEAPAVFLAQTASPGKNTGPGWRVDWPQGAAAPALLLLAGTRDERDDLSAQLLAAHQQREAREDMNLLYVALTRARQFLHVSGFAPRTSGGSRWHALARAALQSLGATATDEDTLVRSLGEPQRAAALAPESALPESDPRLQRPLPNARLAATEAQAAEVVDPAIARRGNAVHFLLQHLTTERPPAAAALRAQLQTQIECSAEEYELWRAEAEAVLAAPALAAFYDRTRLRRAWNEMPLLDGDGTGVIDRLVDDGETLWILDYKTERDSNDAALIERHRLQLEGYRNVVRRLWPGRPVRAGLIATAPPRWLELAS